MLMIPGKSLLFEHFWRYFSFNKYDFVFSTPKAISFAAINDKILFPDMPNGPLDRYRKNASFDWRKLAIILETERCLRFRVRAIHFFENINKSNGLSSTNLEYF